MRRRRRARVRQERRKSENRRPILKMLCAALLWSFRGQHSEKCWINSEKYNRKIAKNVGSRSFYCILYRGKMNFKI